MIQIQFLLKFLDDKPSLHNQKKMYKVTKSDIKTKTKSEVDIFDFFLDLKAG